MNREKIKNYQKQYYQKNKDKIKAYYQRNKNKIIKQVKQYRQKNKDKIIKQKRQYIAKIRTYDENFVIKCRLRNSLGRVLNHYTKTGKAISSKKYGIDYKAIIKKLTPLPFPISEINNYHIDHIRPCKFFDLTNPDEVKQCFSANNLQWLTARENMSKGCRII